MSLSALMLVTLAVSACSGDGEPPACENPQRATTVTMGDFFYEPTCVETTGGTTLDIVNEGKAPHTFTIESDPGADVDVAAGERGTVEVPDLDPGTYSVTCTYHPQMEAALLVRA